MKKLNITNPLYILGFMALVFNSCNTKYKVWVENDSQKIYNLKYGEHKRQKMDVFLPANYAKTDPVILIVHGGAWKYGKKEHMIHIQKMLFEYDTKSSPSEIIASIKTKVGLTLDKPFLPYLEN